MRRIPLVLAMVVFIASGCAHGPQSASDPLSAGQAAGPSSPAVTETLPVTVLPVSDAASSVPVQADPADAVEEDEDDLDYEAEPPSTLAVTIADPLEPFNRAMFTFNDRLYFWVLKPVAEGYSAVVPEPARISVRNFFSNLRAPIRFANCLLQAHFIGAATELFRFMINSTIGVAGLFDPAGGEEINLQRQDEDFGQTLGVYGAGHGFYLVWPILGPSSPRDTVGMVGDFFAYPISYLDPWYVWTAVRGYQAINDTSLTIGDYEALKGAALDPYIAVRNAYTQYRHMKVEERGTIGLAGPDIPGAGTPARGVGTRGAPQP